MDRFEKYIGTVLDGLYLNKTRKSELIAEIQDHLEMTKRELITSGCAEEQAEVEAIRRFGDVMMVRNKFNSVFTPYRILKDSIERNKALNEIVQWTVSILGALIVSLFIRTYAFAQTEVRQDSMQNTLCEGQRLIEIKAEYYFKGPKRGDIVIINREAEVGILKTLKASMREFAEGFYKKDEEDGKRLVKRVIGVPGDVIDIKEGKVYINGDLHDEPYVKGVTFPKGSKLPVEVPENMYFVMGDNRENSLDSRDLGLIAKEKIEGKAVFRTWPLSEFGKIYK